MWGAHTTLRMVRSGARWRTASWPRSWSRAPATALDVLTARARTSFIARRGSLSSSAAWHLPTRSSIVNMTPPGQLHYAPAAGPPDGHGRPGLCRADENRPLGRNGLGDRVLTRLARRLTRPTSYAKERPQPSR